MCTSLPSDTQVHPNRKWKRHAKYVFRAGQAITFTALKASAKITAFLFFAFFTLLPGNQDRLLAMPPYASPEPGSSIPHFCEPQIIDASGSTFGYRFRGDRCEGKYEQPTAGVSEDLAIISFSCPNPQLNLGTSKPTIAWSTIGTSPASIRLETLPQIRLRYRLDAVSSDANGRFSWDGDTWRALSIDSAELAVVVKGTAKIGTNEFPGTLLEARLGVDTSIPDCPTGPTFEIRTARHLSALRACATPLGTDGQVTRDTPICQTLPGSFFPSKSISVKLGVLKSATHMLRVSLEGASKENTFAPPRYFRIKVE
jgi:hypothetical protein